MHRFHLHMIHKILLCAVCLMVMAAPGLAQEQYDMSRSVERALEYSPRMESADASMEAAADARASALGAFFPTLTLTYSYTKLDHPQPSRDAARTTVTNGVVSGYQSDDDVYTLAFNVHQDLFTGFRLLSTFQKALLTEEQTEASARNEELSLILAVQEGFLGLLSARDRVRSAQDAHTRLTSQLKVTQAFYDVGLKPRLDVLQAEVDLASAEDTLLQAQNAVATALSRLDTLLVIPSGQDVEYVGELAFVPFSMTLEECLAEAYQNRPDMVMMRKGVEIASKDVTIAASGLFPQVGADFDWSSTGNDMAVRGQEYSRTEFSEWSVGVYASLQLDFGQTWYGMRQAQQILRQFHADEANLVQEVTYDVTAKHLKIAETQERIRVAQKALELAKEGYRMAVARYQAQVGTNTDVLDAQENLTDAESSLTTAMADYLIAVAQMYVAIGRDNASLVSDYAPQADGGMPVMESPSPESEAAAGEEPENELTVPLSQ